MFLSFKNIFRQRRLKINTSLLLSRPFTSHIFDIQLWFSTVKLFVGLQIRCFYEKDITD